MRTARSCTLLLALCLLLCACVQQSPSPQTNPPISGDQQTDSSGTDAGNTGNTADTSDNTGNTSDKTDPPNYPAELTVELVVEWELADALLSQLEDLADLLHTAIEEAGCPLDSVTVTISTAGGITAQSLVNGGVDIAILPAVDIISYETKVSLIALSEEDPPETAIAVSQTDSALSEEFRQLIFKALTDTDAGCNFLSTCCQTDVAAPNESKLQAVRDYYKEQEKAEGGQS